MTHGPARHSQRGANCGRRLKWCWTTGLVVEGVEGVEGLRRKTASQKEGRRMRG